MALQAYKPLDERGVEILNELERRNGIEAKLIDEDGTRWYDPNDLQNTEESE